MKRNLELFLTFLLGIFFGVIYVGTFKAHTAEPEVIKDTQYVYIESEPEIKTEYVYIPFEEVFFRNLSEDDEFYYKDLAMREAEGEDVIGILWVMYTFECRCEAFNHTPAEEWASSAYETSMNRSGKTPNDNVNEAFELFREGWTPKPLNFRAGSYHEIRSPLCQVGNHYFSA